MISEIMASGYNELPPIWVFDFWLVIVACFAPFVLVLCLMFPVRLIQLRRRKGLDRFS